MIYHFTMKVSDFHSMMVVYLDRISPILRIRYIHVNLLLLRLTILEEIDRNLREQRIG